jgi:hypothetical protein
MHPMAIAQEARLTIGDRFDESRLERARLMICMLFLSTDTTEFTGI